MRLLDWPERMAEAIAYASERPFTDTYFCATFCADVVLAMTGVDYMAAWRDLTQEEAEARVVSEFGSVDGYLESRFGEPVIPAWSQRGDVVVKIDETGYAIGICCGINSAFAGEDGLVYFNTLDCERAYSV